MPSVASKSRLRKRLAPSQLRVRGVRASQGRRRHLSVARRLTQRGPRRRPLAAAAAGAAAPPRRAELIITLFVHDLSSATGVPLSTRTNVCSRTRVERPVCGALETSTRILEAKLANKAVRGDSQTGPGADRVTKSIRSKLAQRRLRPAHASPRILFICSCCSASGALGSEATGSNLILELLRARENPKPFRWRYETSRSQRTVVGRSLES